VVTGRSAVQSAAREGDGVISLDSGDPRALASFATRATLVSRPPSFSPLPLWAGVVNRLPLGGDGVVERGLGLLELLFYSQPQPWQGRTVDP
jgi:hypothetical protein